MHKQTVCVCVCVCVCVFHLHSRVCLEPRLQVWVQAPGVWGALCTCCTEVGGWVSRLGSCNVQWELFGTLIEQNCESSIFHFIHNRTYGYQECRAFTRILPVPWEVVKQTVLITTVQNGTLLPWLSKIEGSVSPALGCFFPSVVCSPLFTEIKSH